MSTYMVFHHTTSAMRAQMAEVPPQQSHSVAGGRISTRRLLEIPGS